MEDSFYIRRYLTSVERLPDEEKLLELIDSHRRQKLMGRKRNRAWTESLGAGLLLQKAVLDYLTWSGECCGGDTAAMRTGAEMAETFQEISADDLIEELSGGFLAGRLPLELSYRYGEWGKPYFVGQPLFFSLSHSDGMVLCVVAEREVGADIQCVQNPRENKLVERFFSEEEKQLWRQLGAKDREAFFYRAWTGKEAYGKLLGVGVARVLDKNPDAAREELCREEFRWRGAYIAVCYGKE